MSSAIYVRVVVFKGSPLDYQKYRHTALWFQIGDESITAHVIGSRGAFEFEVKDNYNPVKSLRFAKYVDVGWLRATMTKAQLVALVSQTPPDNRDSEFNCQTWVGQVLSRLKDQGMISQEEAFTGLDGMVQATLEAEDDPE